MRILFAPIIQNIAPPPSASIDGWTEDDEFPEETSARPALAVRESSLASTAAHRPVRVSCNRRRWVISSVIHVLHSGIDVLVRR